MQIDQILDSLNERITFIRIGYSRFGSDLLLDKKFEDKFEEQLKNSLSHLRCPFPLIEVKNFP